MDNDSFNLFNMIDQLILKNPALKEVKSEKSSIFIFNFNLH